MKDSASDFTTFPLNKNELCKTSPNRVNKYP